MSGHTPGEWTCEEWLGDPEPFRAVGLEPTPNVSNDGARYIMAGERRIALVDCQTKFKRGHGHKVVCAERDANARLIAAAPDLLAALKETREVAAACFRAVASMGLIDSFLAQLPKELADRSKGFGVRADKAIAKAEGDPR